MSGHPDGAGLGCGGATGKALQRRWLAAAVYTHHHLHYRPKASPDASKPHAVGGEIARSLTGHGRATPH
jgi:hypothetical protein